MKRTHLFGTVMACALAAAVSVGAQDRPSTDQSDPDSKTVVVTGCLKSDPASPSTAGTAGTTGSTATAASRATFIVTDAMVSSGSGSTAGATSTTSPTGTSPTGTTPPTTTPPTGTTPPTTSPTAGTTGTSGASSAADSKTFSLVGGSPSELQNYVNSKVEIRGTLDSRSGASGTPATGTGATGTTPPSGTGSTMSGMSHNQQLRVSSVKQIAGSCSGQ